LHDSSENIVHPSRQHLLILHWFYTFEVNEFTRMWELSRMFDFRILMVWILLSTANMAAADTSWFFKLNVFRFAKEELVKTQNGIVDLSTLGNEEFFHVQGDVYFFPGEFINPSFMSPEEFLALVTARKAVLLPLNLRSGLNTHEGLSNFGTFILRFKNPRDRDISLQFPRFYHPMDVFIAHKAGASRVIRADHVKTDPDRNRNINPFISSIPLIPVDGDFLLFAQVSSPFQEGKSSINISTFYIGEEHVISRLLYYNRFASAAVIGAFSFIFLYYSFIYLFRLRDISSLYLSLFALFCVSLCSFYVIEYDWNPSEVVDRFIILNAFAIGFLQLYILEKLKQWIGSRTYRYSVITAWLLPSLVLLLIVGKAYFIIGLIFVFSLLSSLALILTTIVLGYRHSMNGLGYFVFGTVCNMIFQVPVMIKYIQGDNSEAGYIILLANFFMAIGLALVNAKEFAVTYRTSIQQARDLERKNKEITFFNHNLEKLVANKTKEVRSLLDHIPQGVLSIGIEGRVSKDYSAHLATVIGTRDIAQRSFKELLLDPSLLSPDIKDQAWQTILASIGETALNFELNVDKLPNEIPFILGDRQKCLKATWNTEIENDRVQQILVTLLDVTLEKSLEKESEKNRKELRMIEEMINIAPNKAAQFFLTSTPLFEESQRLIAAFDPQQTATVVRTLFVNAHTIKGAARTLQLRDLADAVHEMEEYYQVILKGDLAVDRARLHRDLEKGLAVLQSYRDVNRNKLGRDDDFEKISMERAFIESHHQLLENILRGESADISGFVDVLREHSRTLTRTIFEELPAIFDAYKEKALQISSDVGKTAPRFAFEILPIWIPPALRTVLDYAMIHILRNAMDHGIESAEERRKAGKNPSGLITILTRQAGSRLLIRIEDDGRGLAIDKLRERGIKQGILSDGSSPEEIATLIFASGVTTADKVSMLSGRGMGMDAVRVFLEKVGADIRIALGSAIPGEREFRHFCLEISLPIGSARHDSSTLIQPLAV